MHEHGQTTTWGTPIGIGHAPSQPRWYQQLKAWWTAHTATRHAATLATLTARWDARREAVRVCHADAAVDMLTPAHARSTATALCDLGV